jgi:hypothetical protein
MRRRPAQVEPGGDNNSGSSWQRVLHDQIRLTEFQQQHRRIPSAGCEKEMVLIAFGVHGGGNSPDAGMQAIGEFPVGP